MGVDIKSFGKTKNGQEVSLYTITNSKGMKAVVTDFGAILVDLFVPDAEGNVKNVVLGFETLEEYEKNPSFFGATIGPNANRIAGAQFVVDGKVVKLDVNDGDNNLHSHRELGYHKQVWAAACADNSVTFTLDDPATMGFPGNKKFRVTYTLGEENDLRLKYHATSDANTVINPTNHTYFNLKGRKNGDILEHELWLKASGYTPVVAGAIPTGEIAAVAGTPMDFTTAKQIGLEIDADFEQLQLTTGYDHNWVIDDWNGELQHMATVKSPDGALAMKVFTTLPGVQFYAGNYTRAENGEEYAYRAALCLETQYYPNSANEPAFPSCFFGPDKDYESETVYQF